MRKGRKKSREFVGEGKGRKWGRMKMTLSDCKYVKNQEMISHILCMRYGYYT
jgi:hypothetical protein